MSDIFNGKRFLTYWKHDLRRAWDTMGLNFLTCALFPVIYYVIHMIIKMIFSHPFGGIVHGPGIEVRLSLLAGISLVTAILMPKKIYGVVTDKDQGTQWFMAPASRLEKFISMSVNLFVLIPVVFFILFLCSDALVCLLGPNCGKPVMNVILPPMDLGGDIAINWTLFGFSAFCQTSALFLLGALVFKKNKVIYTILCVFAFQVVVLSAFSTLSQCVDFDSFFEKLAEWIAGSVHNPELFVNSVAHLSTLAYMAIFGTGAWFALKKRQL